jgi:hypothetical protein
MDDETDKAFVAHVKDLESRAIAGDLHACKSLACMALLVDGCRPSSPDGGGEVIDFMPFLKAA